MAAIHPFGKLPVMRHGDFTLYVFKAIATYLDCGFPGPALMPSDARLAAVAEQWISLVNTALDSTLVRTYIYHYIFPKSADGKPDKPAIEAMAPSMRRQMACSTRQSPERAILLATNSPSPTSM